MYVGGLAQVALVISLSVIEDVGGGSPLMGMEEWFIYARRMTFLGYQYRTGRGGEFAPSGYHTADTRGVNGSKKSEMKGRKRETNRME